MNTYEITVTGANGVSLTKQVSIDESRNEGYATDYVATHATWKGATSPLTTQSRLVRSAPKPSRWQRFWDFVLRR